MSPLNSELTQALSLSRVLAILIPLRWLLPIWFTPLFVRAILRRDPVFLVFVVLPLLFFTFPLGVLVTVIIRRSPLGQVLGMSKPSLFPVHLPSCDRNALLASGKKRFVGLALP